MIAEKSLVVTKVRRNVLVQFKHREEGCVEIRNVAQQVGGAWRKPAVLLDKFPGLEHEGLPLGSVDATRSVAFAEHLHISHLFLQAEQLLALLADDRVVVLENLEMRVVLQVARSSEGEFLRQV